MFPIKRANRNRPRATSMSMKSTWPYEVVATRLPPNVDTCCAPCNATGGKSTGELEREKSHEYHNAYCGAPRENWNTA